MTCAFDKYKDYLEKYYALNFLIRDITYMHDLSKICVCELFNLIYIIIIAYWCYYLYHEHDIKKEVDMLLLWNIM